LQIQKYKTAFVAFKQGKFLTRFW